MAYFTRPLGLLLCFCGSDRCNRLDLHWLGGLYGVCSAGLPHISEYIKRALYLDFFVSTISFFTKELISDNNRTVYYSLVDLDCFSN